MRLAVPVDVAEHRAMSASSLLWSACAWPRPRCRRPTCRYLHVVALSNLQVSHPDLDALRLALAFDEQLGVLEGESS